MPFGEGSTGAGFEIAFESDRLVRIGKLDRDDQVPGAVLGGVGRLAPVVGGKAFGRILSEPDVASIRILRTPKNVDETPS